MTQDSFTRLAGFSPRAVAHWASGRTPGGSAQKRLTELTRLFDALSDLVDAEAIGEWLKQPNPAFDGSTPLQVIERGGSHLADGPGTANREHGIKSLVQPRVS